MAIPVTGEQAVENLLSLAQGVARLDNDRRKVGDLVRQFDKAHREFQ